MLIRIKTGIFGHKEGKKIVPKTKDSEPFELNDKRANELIVDGVAEQVIDANVEEVKTFEEMTKAELLEYAKASNIIVNSKAKKEDLIEIIEKASEEENEDDGSDGDNPEFQTAGFE